MLAQKAREPQDTRAAIVGIRLALKAVDSKLDDLKRKDVSGVR